MCTKYRHTGYLAALLVALCSNAASDTPPLTPPQTPTIELLEHAPESDEKPKEKQEFPVNGLVYHDDLLSHRLLTEPFENTKPEAGEPVTKPATDNITYAVHPGIHTAVPPPPDRPSVPWMRIKVNKNYHWGSGTRNLMPHLGTEGFLAYDIFVENFKTAHSTKMLGIAGNYSVGVAKPKTAGYSNAKDWPYYQQSPGGNGGGGSERAPFGPNGEGKSWSARGEMTGTIGTHSLKGLMGFEVYHSDSPTILADGRQFGEFFQAKKNHKALPIDDLPNGNSTKWHRVKIYLKLNDIGQNNGILRMWFDYEESGKQVAVYERTNIHFTDNPQYRNIAIYNNVWHGGHYEAPVDFYIHYANLRTWAGPTDLDP